MNTRKSIHLAVVAALVLVSAAGRAMAVEAAPGAHAHGMDSARAHETAVPRRHHVSAPVRRQGMDKLRLTFDEGAQHARLKNVRLDIFDSAHKDVFSRAEAHARTDVQLPPGRYRIVAKAGGIARSRQVDLKPGASKNVALHWPRSAAKA